MKNEFVTYNQALRLKEIGFDEPCFGYYSKSELTIEIIKSGKIFTTGLEDSIYFERDNSCLAPTFSQAFRWFRQLNLIGHVRESWSFDNKLEYVSQINGTFVNHDLFDKPVNRFDTYEEAELACLDKLIEMVEPKKEDKTNWEDIKFPIVKNIPEKLLSDSIEGIPTKDMPKRMAEMYQAAHNHAIKVIEKELNELKGIPGRENRIKYLEELLIHYRAL